jgi:hypothetical protein
MTQQDKTFPQLPPDPVSLIHGILRRSVNVITKPQDKLRFAIPGKPLIGLIVLKILLFNPSFSPTMEKNLRKWPIYCYTRPSAGNSFLTGESTLPMEEIWLPESG